MDGVVALDPALFRGSYPELAALTPQQLANYWTMSGQFCDNTPASVITDWSAGGARATCLNAMVAHIATLMGNGPQGAARGGLVGRIASAGQGSVNVSLDMPSNPEAAWFMQTQYGTMFWQLTSPYRMALYVR